MKKEDQPALTASARKRIAQAEARTQHAEARTEQAEIRTGQAEARTEQAKSRADAAETRAEQAESRTERAKTRTEHAEVRSEQAQTALEECLHPETEQNPAEAPSPRGGTAPPAASTPPGPLDQLTPRHREILKLIADGHNTKQIADTLNVSPKTIEYHRMKLMKALDLHDVPSLVRFAVRVGLVAGEN